MKNKYKLEKPSLEITDLIPENSIPSNLGIVLDHSRKTHLKKYFLKKF